MVNAREAIFDRICNFLAVNVSAKPSGSEQNVLLPKKKVLQNVIQGFGVRCFKSYRLLDPTNWRLGKKCTKGGFTDIERLYSDDDASLMVMPNDLVQKCQRYMDYLLTDDRIDELYRMDGNIKGFQFSPMPAKDAQFIQQFADEMYDWMEMDPDRMHKLDQSGVVLTDIANILVSFKTLSSVDTPKAKEHLQYLSPLMQKYTPIICALVVLRYFLVSLYIQANP